MTTNPRVLTVRLMCAVQLVNAMQCATSVSMDRNGQKGAYQRLYFRTADKRWRGFYLGQVSANVESILGFQTRLGLSQRIRHIQQQRRTVRRIVGMIVGKNGGNRENRTVPVLFGLRVFNHDDEL